MTFLAFLCGAALIMAGYLVVRTYARRAESPAGLPVTVNTAYRGSFVLDPNTAPVDSLELLPGIGPALADSIVKYRATMRFETVDDLDQVGGIGPKTIEKMRPYLSLGER